MVKTIVIGSTDRTFRVRTAVPVTSIKKFIVETVELTRGVRLVVVLTVTVVTIRLGSVVILVARTSKKSKALYASVETACTAQLCVRS